MISDWEKQWATNCCELLDKVNTVSSGYAVDETISATISATINAIHRYDSAEQKYKRLHIIKGLIDDELDKIDQLLNCPRGTHPN